MNLNEKILLCANLLLYGALAIFSYAYVDLNLTISQNPLILNFVGFMQKLGYFNRSTATVIYLAFLIFTFGLFLFNLWLIKKSKVGSKYLLIATIASTLILIFAYPFLSSDLFNYLFDAKIILKYHASPYTHKALDFPQDEWLRFMRWTHRYSPYGPLWLVMSLIPAILGLGKFILNFFAFKIFIALLHLLNVYLIHKILVKTNPKLTLFGTAFYALNPIFLIEGVANAHNDVVLATFLLLSVYFVVTNKDIHSTLALLGGALIKYIPILNLPWIILKILRPNKIKFTNLIILNIATMAAFTFLFSTFRISVPFVSTGATQVQFQPWYLFWTIPYIALLPQSYLIIPSILISFGALLRYLPYLYYGDWTHQGTTEFMRNILLVALFFGIAVMLIKFQKGERS